MSAARKPIAELSAAAQAMLRQPLARILRDAQIGSAARLRQVAGVYSELACELGRAGHFDVALLLAENVGRALLRAQAIDRGAPVELPAYLEVVK